MFRMAPPGAEKVNVEEEQRAMRKTLIGNIALFASIVVALRLAPVVIEKLSS